MAEAIDKLLKLTSKTNLAGELSDDLLTSIGRDVCKMYKVDRESRREWEDVMIKAMKFAKQITEPKNTPFKNASNVILPMISVATLVFASRAYPEIVKGDDIVNIQVLGEDIEGAKAQRAENVSTHMSYQLLVQNESWEKDLDKSLHILPLVGTVFKKTYYDVLKDCPQAELCNPADIVVNHNVASLSDAKRITHRYYLTKNEVITKIRQNLYRDVAIEELESVSNGEFRWDTDLDSNSISAQDHEEDGLYEILEEHGYLDLDGDGYEEPYITVVNKRNSEVLGIYPRFDPLVDVRLNDDGKIVHIEPTQYFIDYHFLPSPDGGFYSIGYGQLLYPLNNAANSIMNQLIDAGTLANTKGGLIDRQIALRNQKIQHTLGQYTPVDSGNLGRLSDGVHDFQFGEPSAVLLQLLGLVLESIKEISSINDVLTGQALPQNSPAGSVNELASQGLKLFGSVAKRFYRSLKKELTLIFKLNQQYLTQESYFKFHDDLRMIAKEDYELDNIDVVPVADPQLASETQKSMQTTALLTLTQNPQAVPFLKMDKIITKLLTTMKLPEREIADLVIDPATLQQGPSPEEIKIQLEQQKMQFEQQMAMLEQQNKKLELQIKLMDVQSKYAIKEDELDSKIAERMADAAKTRKEMQQMDRKLNIEEDRNRITEKAIEKK